MLRKKYLSQWIDFLSDSLISCLNYDVRITISNTNKWYMIIDLTRLLPKQRNKLLMEQLFPFINDTLVTEEVLSKTFFSLLVTLDNILYMDNFSKFYTSMLDLEKDMSILERRTVQYNLGRNKENTLVTMVNFNKEIKPKLMELLTPLINTNPKDYDDDKKVYKATLWVNQFEYNNEEDDDTSDFFVDEEEEMENDENDFDDDIEEEPIDLPSPLSKRELKELTFTPIYDLIAKQAMANKTNKEEEISLEFPKDKLFFIPLKRKIQLPTGLILDVEIRFIKVHDSARQLYEVTTVTSDVYVCELM